jgi:hypothetical protein
LQIAVFSVILQKHFDSRPSHLRQKATSHVRCLGHYK